MLAALLALPLAAASQTPQDTIERVRRSIVAVGTFQASRVPQFQFRGTGFVVGDGSLVATNAHVLPEQALGPSEVLAVALPMSAGNTTKAIAAAPVSVDPDRDMAVLRVSGLGLPPLVLGDSDRVREGDGFLVTGFPLGTLIGTFPVTHRAWISAIVPIAIPRAHSSQLDPARIRRLQEGAFPVFQLDATIFPGNSGSPLYDPVSGEVVGMANMTLVRKLREGEAALPSGISYAVPVRHLREMLGSAKPDAPARPSNRN